MIGSIQPGNRRGTFATPTIAKLEIELEIAKTVRDRMRTPHRAYDWLPREAAAAARARDHFKVVAQLQEQTT